MTKYFIVERRSRRFLTKEPYLGQGLYTLKDAEGYLIYPKDFEKLVVGDTEEELLPILDLAKLLYPGVAVEFFIWPFKVENTLQLTRI